jgi:transitional endoplasmic reticulum ATPase
LTGYLDGVPGGEDVDAAAVAAVFNMQTSGADIREIVRRAVLANGAVTTEALTATVRSGRFKPQMPSGNYL